MQLIKDTFEAHQPKIGAFARRESDNFADVFRFVIATIQQPLSMTPDIVRDFKAEGSSSRFAFGHKATALDYIDENAGLVYDTAMYISHVERNCTGHNGSAALLSYFASLPGLGLVKGGFLAQLVFGEIGCLDSHNIARFGLNQNTFAAARFKNAKRTATRQAVVGQYLKLIEACGGCALLWAEWCEHVAQRDDFYDDAAHVSRLHCEAIGVE